MVAVEWYSLEIEQDELNKPLFIVSSCCAALDWAEALESYISILFKNKYLVYFF